MHRAFSWIAAADCEIDDKLDAKLIFRWIGLNSLYGTWNTSKAEPDPDFFVLQKFCQKIFKLDRDGVFSACLQEKKQLVLSIFDNKFLNDYFWKTLNTNKSFSVTRNKFLAQKWFVDKSWETIAEKLLECIYLVRCQLVHGASTYGGKLNRPAVRRCSLMLDALLKSILVVIIDHGLTQNWDNLCYPPVGPANTTNSRLPSNPR